MQKPAYLLKYSISAGSSIGRSATTLTGVTSLTIIDDGLYMIADSGEWSSGNPTIHKDADFSIPAGFSGYAVGNKAASKYEALPVQTNDDLANLQFCFDSGSSKKLEYSIDGGSTWNTILTADRSSVKRRFARIVSGRSGSGAGKSIASSPLSNSDSKRWLPPPSSPVSRASCAFLRCMPSLSTPVETAECSLSLSFLCDAAFPECPSGRLPQQAFRGIIERLLALRPASSRDHQVTLFIEGSDGFVASSAASIATGQATFPRRDFHPLKYTRIHGARTQYS